MIDRNEEIQDPEELQRTIFETLQASLWTALPCIVESVDLTAQTLSAVPAIKAKVADKDGNKTDVELPLVVDVPICFPRAGGFALTFPVAAGDEVLIIFASRCIDAWWQSGGIQAQAELRMHDLSDGFAILAPTSQPKALSNVSLTNMQLRDEAGTSFVEIHANGNINVVSSNNISASNAAGTGFIYIDTAGNVVIKGTTITLDSDVTITGDIGMYFNKVLTTGLGVDLVKHNHAQANDGGGSSEADTNGPKNP